MSSKDDAGTLVLEEQVKTLSDELLQCQVCECILFWVFVLKPCVHASVLYHCSLYNVGFS